METDPVDVSGAQLTLVVVGDGGEVVIARMHGVRPDLDLVASLAGLRLAAQRLGIDVQVRQPCTTLHSLIALVGLDDVLLGDRRDD